VDTQPLVIILALGALGLVIALWRARNRAAEQARSIEAMRLSDKDREAQLVEVRATLAQAKASLERAAPYLDVADAVDEAARLRHDAATEVTRLTESASAEADRVKQEARDQARLRLEKAEQQLSDAGKQAAKIIADAEKRGEEIAGDAYKALKNADHLKRVADAMQNKIEGYGDRYIVPTYSLLDELADAYGFAEAGAIVASSFYLRWL